MKKIILLSSCIVWGNLLFSQNVNYPTDKAGNAGSNNTCIGYNSGINVTGNRNAFLGMNSGINNTSGVRNCYIGYCCGQSGTTANYNTFIGCYSGNSNIGSNNLYLGYRTGSSGTSCTGNTYLGTYSGYENETGSKNVFIGYMAGYSETGSNKLYISNSSATSPLIYGDFSNETVTINGNFGIGTSDPSYALEVVGGVNFNIGTEKYLHFSAWELAGDGGMTIDANDNNGNHTPLAFAASNFLFHGGEVECGEIVVAELNATEINSKGITLAVDNVADYVFDKDYNLLSLNEVDQFISKNKHLPGLPKGTDLENNGMNVAEMSNLLLEKVEELTLYMIELKKENELLKSEINNLKK